MTSEPCLYTKEHEWLRAGKSPAPVGITQYAANQLGDVTFVELPKVGRTVARGEPLAVVESVKAVSDVYAPAGGTVAEANERLETEPELINQSPLEEGWICTIKLSDESELEGLLDAKGYAKHLQELEAPGNPGSPA